MWTQCKFKKMWLVSLVKYLMALNGEHPLYSFLIKHINEWRYHKMEPTSLKKTCSFASVWTPEEEIMLDSQPIL